MTTLAKRRPKSDPTIPLLTISLPKSSSAGQEARAEILVLQEAIDEMADTLRLVATELVNNVVAHAHTPARLRLHVNHEGVLVQVDDYAPDSTPEAAQTESAGAKDPLAPSGRGLHMVESLSTDSGCFVPDGGECKTVWALIPWPPRR